jgi:hypothetical protein
MVGECESLTIWMTTYSKAAYESSVAAGNFASGAKRYSIEMTTAPVETHMYRQIASCESRLPKTQPPPW